MAFLLGDDGTMDTVVYCEHCGAEMRYTYDPQGPDDCEDNGVEQDEPGGYWRIRYRGDLLSAGYATQQGAEIILNEWLYADFVKECITDATEYSEHECSVDSEDI